MFTASTSGLMNFYRREYIIFSNSWYKNEDNGLSDWKNFRKGFMTEATYWKNDILTGIKMSSTASLTPITVKLFVSFKFLTSFWMISSWFQWFQLSTLVLHFPKFDWRYWTVIYFLVVCSSGWAVIEQFVYKSFVKQCLHSI